MAAGVCSSGPRSGRSSARLPGVLLMIVHRVVLPLAVLMAGSSHVELRVQMT